MEMVEGFLTKMYRTNADFVFTVNARLRALVPRRRCLILLDDIPAHPYAVSDGSRECSRRSAEASMLPVEGAAGADSDRGAADSLVLASASTG